MSTRSQLGTISFASHLAQARLRMRRGAAMLDSFAVIAFATSAWLSLTTLAGVWMFWQRMPHTDDLLANKLLAQLSEFSVAGLDMSKLYQALPDGSTFDVEAYAQSAAQGTGLNLMIFSLVALGVLLIPLLALGIGAARLGAQGRTKRLAALRLIGMTAGHVRRLALVETLVQFTIGFGIGFVIYVASLPAWSLLEFNMQPLSIAEMLLPWWAVIAIFAVLAALASISTIIGLITVSISPLGVTRRVSQGAMRWWRVGAFAAIIAGIVYVLSTQDTRDYGINDALRIVILFGAILSAALVSLAIIGPFAVQLLGRLLRHTNSPARLLAARRLIDDPRRAWRNISGITLMSLIATFTALVAAANLTKIPGKYAHLEPGSLKGTVLTTQETWDLARHSVHASFTSMMMGDMVKGVMIAFAFALILGAVATLIQQGSDVFDRAPEEKALVQLGAPAHVFARARIQQVMWPFLAAMLLSIGLGFLAFITGIKPEPENVRYLAWIIGAGVIVTLIPVLLMIPLERHVLATQQRRND